MLSRKSSPPPAVSPSTAAVDVLVGMVAALLRSPSTCPPPPPTTSATKPPSAHLEPAECFSELDERETLFVIAYALGSGPAESALAAGYSNGNPNAARSMASRLLRRPHILKAIKEETGRRLVAAAPLGVSTLEQLARSARSEQVKLSAARDLVDRGHGPVVSRSANANLNVNTGIEELLKKLDSEGRPQPSDWRAPTTIDGTARHPDDDSE